MFPEVHLLAFSLNDSSYTLDETNCEYFSEYIHLAYHDNLIQSFVIVKTCLRLECYYIADNLLVPPFFAEKAIVLEGTDVVRYLFELACGMRSLLKGEDQILHQIKKAYHEALIAKHTNSFLNVLFNKTIALGKKFRHLSGITSHALSLEALVLKKIKAHHPKALSQKILILGLGDLSQSIMYLLLKEKATSLSITNRSWHKTRQIAVAHGVCPVDFHKKNEALDQADIIISATSAPHFIVTKECFKSNKSRLFIDLALPADISPEVMTMGKIITLQDIWSGKDANISLRETLVEEYSYLIDEEIALLTKRFVQIYA
ncbi:MAG: NAD(P)-binding domain-containing protein [Brevinema sp.]